MSNWDYPANNVPKPKVGCPAWVAGEQYTVASVSRAGTKLVLTRDRDGAQLEAKRAPIGRIPRELSRADVSPRYYARSVLGMKLPVRLGQ